MKKHKPSLQEYLRHELLDRTCNAMHILEVLFDQHPSLLPDDDSFTPAQRKKINKLLDKAGASLAEAYQYIGEIHL